MKARSGFRLQTVILMITLPALAAVTALYAFFVYKDVYHTILEGFDRKLFAASTTSSVFIDGDDHDLIVKPRGIRTLVHMEIGEKSALVGIDAGQGLLVEIDPQTGEAADIIKIQAPERDLRAVTDLTFLPGEAKIAGLIPDQNTIIVIDPVSGAVSRKFGFKNSPGRFSGLEYVPESGSFYLSGTGLGRISENGAKIENIGDGWPDAVTSLTYDRAEKRLIGVSGSGGEMYVIDTADGTRERAGKLEEPAPQAGSGEETGESSGESSGQWVEPEVINLPAHSVAAYSAGGKIYALTDRLISFDSESGTASAAGFRFGFRNENSDRYRRYSLPMKEILNSLGLTYHYTLIPIRDNFITYVIDATEGEDHSPVGTEEENPEDEARRLLKVMKTGEASLSDIQQFDIWGLLKIGTAPIFNSRREIKGLAGADVNISVIHSKTREAMLQVLAVGAIALLLAFLASLVIARKLLEPINLLKEAALRVAAGKFEYRLDVKQPMELRRLSESFKAASSLLKDSVVNIAIQRKTFEDQRRRQELIKLFSTEGAESENGPDAASALSVEILNGRGLSGSAEHGEIAVVWTAGQNMDLLEGARRHSDIKAIASKILRKYPGDWEKVTEKLESLAGGAAELMLCIDRAGGRIKKIGRKSDVPAIVWGQAGSELRSFGDRDSLCLSGGEAVFIMPGGPAASGDTIGRLVSEMQDSLAQARSAVEVLRAGADLAKNAGSQTLIAVSRGQQ